MAGTRGKENSMPALRPSASGRSRCQAAAEPAKKKPPRNSRRHNNALSFEETVTAEFPPHGFAMRNSPMSWSEKEELISEMVDKAVDREVRERVDTITRQLYDDFLPHIAPKTREEFNKILEDESPDGPMSKLERKLEDKVVKSVTEKVSEGSIAVAEGTSQGTEDGRGIYKTLTELTEDKKVLDERVDK